MKLVIDTNVYSDFNRGDTQLRTYFTKNNDLYVPFVVIAELRSGFMLGNRFIENETLLAEFLDQPEINTLYATDKTTRLFAEVFCELRKIGRPINTNDIWIAALCIENNLTLLTKDVDFKHIPKLLLV